MDKTAHGINVFENADTSMSFKEWRDLIAAKTVDSSTSNMEIINNLFTEYVNYMKSLDGEVEAKLIKEIEHLKNGLSGLIETDAQGSTLVGNNNKIIFKNSPDVEMVDGVLKILGIDAYNYIKTSNYMVSEKLVNGEPHLSISYTKNV